MNRRIIIFLWVVMGAVMSSYAQQFPMSVTPSFWGIPTPVLLDNASAISPKLNIQIHNRDGITPAWEARLWVRIEGQNTGLVLETKPNYSANQPIVIFTNQLRSFTGDEIAPYISAQNMNISGTDAQKFLQDGTLPEDFYTFTFIVYQWDGRAQLSDRATIANYFNLSDPPLLTVPQDAMAVQALTPQSVLFSWSPRHSPLPDNAQVEYKFELWEVLQGRNPQEVALYQQPIQTITTFNLTQLYDITHTVLDTGKTYAWRVRAQTAGGKGYFRNSGYSEVYSFRYLSPAAMPYTDAPTNFELMKTNLTSAEFKWDTDPRYQSYRLEYRVKGGNRWIASTSTTGDGIANQLEPDKEYQARVAGYNATADIYGFNSRTIDFRTPKVPVFKCGETPDQKPLPPRPPLAALRKGDVVKMGSYNLYVTNVSGGGGTFSGTGIVNVPFLIQILSGQNLTPKSATEAIRTGFAVTYNNIGVDDDYNMTTGRVDVMTAGWKDMMTAVMDDEYNASVGKVKTGAPEIAGKVDISLDNVTKAESVKEIKDSTGKVVGASIKIKDPATGKETEIKAESMPANIQDKTGKTYSVDKNGNISPVGIPDPNAPSPADANTVVASSRASVKWENTADSKYFLDDKTDSRIAKAHEDKYKLGVLNAGTETSYAAWKAIAEGASEPIKATITLTDQTLNKDSIIFITGKGMKYITKKTGANTYEISLAAPPSGDMLELYCRVKDAQGKYQTIGKLLVESFAKKERMVVLVPIAGATKESIQSLNLKPELNKIFNGANAHWDVQVAESLDISSLGITAITAESKLFPCYSPEMRKINGYLKKQSIYATDNKISYVFVVGSGITKPSGVDGEMPRGKQFGYIFGTPTAELLAHELGHGAYKFKHTFSEIPEIAQGSSSPKNLEDYAPGRYLYKYQWDQIHFPLQDEFTCLESDEEGQGILNSNQICGIKNSSIIERLKQETVFPVLIGSNKTGFVKLYKNCEVKNVYVHNGNVYLSSFYYDGKLFEDAVRTSVTIVPENATIRKRYDESKYHLFVNSINKREGFTFPYASASQLTDTFSMSYDMGKNKLRIHHKGRIDSFEQALEKCGEYKNTEHLSETKISYFYDLLNGIRRGYIDNTYLDLYTIYQETLSKPFYIGNTTEFIEPYEWFEDMNLFIPSLKKNYTFKNIEIQKRFYNTMISPRSIHIGNPKNMWGQSRPAVIIEDKDRRQEIVLIYTETEAERDLLYEYMTTAPPKDSRILLFVNGFMPDYSQVGGSTNLYSYDPFDYWEDFDDEFMARRQTYNVVYASGHDKISTSNHGSEANFVCSMQNCCTDENAYCFTDFDVQGAKGEAMKKVFQELAEKAGDKVAKNKYFKAFSYIVKLGCLLKKDTTDCYLNKTPYPSGYQTRFNNGKKAAEKMRDDMKSGKISQNYANGKYGDTVDVVCHSMGFAYAMGMIDQLQTDGIKVGKVYVIAPENAASGSVPAGVEEFWQYGSDEVKFAADKQDGVAPQAAIKGINDKSKYKEGGRAYIPDEVPKGFLLSHFIGNYKWIFTKLKTPSQNGYVKPRK